MSYEHTTQKGREVKITNIDIDKNCKIMLEIYNDVS